MFARGSVFPVLFPMLIGVWLSGCAASLQDAKLTQTAYNGETEDFNVPPTDKFRGGTFEAPTPLQVLGATTITTPQLRDKMLSSTPPIVVDVLSPPPTQSLPGAISLPEAGWDTNQTQAKLKAALTTLTGGNPARTLVFLCLSRTCWLSYNATLRAVHLGYTQVYWYRGGHDAWRAAGLAMTPAARGAW